MTQALIAGGGVLVLGFFIWLAMNAARRQGAAETRAESEREARKAEQEMTDVTMQPRDPSQPRSSMEDGSF